MIFQIDVLVLFSRHLFVVFSSLFFPRQNLEIQSDIIPAKLLIEADVMTGTILI